MIPCIMEMAQDFLVILFGENLIFKSIFIVKRYIQIGMGCKKDITEKEKQCNVRLLSDGNTIMEIVKKFNRYHWYINSTSQSY